MLKITTAKVRVMVHEILNPVTKVFQDENSFCEMEMVQIRGVTSTVRDTDAELGAGAKLNSDREASY